MFKKVSLKVKLVAAFLATASLVLLLSLLNVRAIRTIHDAYDDVVDNQVPGLNALQEMRILASEIKIGSIIYQQSSSSDSAADKQKNELLADLDKMAEQEAEYSDLLDEAAADGSSHTDQTQNEQIASAREAVLANVFDLIDLKEQGGHQDQIKAKETKLANAVINLEKSISIGIDENLSHIRSQDEVADEQVDQLVKSGALFSALSGVFALLLGIFMSFSIARRLDKLKEGSERVANGDFNHTITVKSKDEIGLLASYFNQMSARLKTSYQRLAYESKRDETLLESMNDGLIALDAEGHVVLMNSVAAHLLEYDSTTRPIGKLFSETIVLHDEYDKGLAPGQLPGTMTLQTGQQSQNVYVYITKARTKIQINISASPVVMDTQTAGAILVLRDVTREKEIDRMKTEFISLASHQLRTPLSAIKWFSEMLLSGDAGKLQEEQADFAKNISDSTERMIQLVNSLLNISRIESGRIIVDPKPTDLKDLVGGIINDLTAKTKQKQQNMIISVHDELPKINLDPHLIGQVYLNLLTNAIKYTPKGGEISVFISKKDDQIISQVTDDGYGIPKAQQNRVFQKFFRAENITKHETDGTGLGLYLIKSIIESSNGKIWFESEENKGTTFWFSLPLSGMKPREGEVSLEM